MEHADELLIPEELPGQLTFVPETPGHQKARYSAEMNGEANLNDPSRIAILICDVLAHFDGTLPTDWLYDIMVGAEHVSYFLYEDALGYLISIHSVLEQDGQYTLTANGKVTAKRLRQYVPKLFRDQVMLTALRYVARQKALRDLQITYEDCDGGCMVCLRCSDQGREMFFLRIRAANRSDAEMLGERILRNPAGFFGKVLDLAFRNEEEQFDLTDN